MNDRPAPLMHSARSTGRDRRYLMLAGFACFSNSLPRRSDISMWSFCFHRLLGRV